MSKLKKIQKILDSLNRLVQYHEAEGAFTEGLITLKYIL